VREVGLQPLPAGLVRPERGVPGREVPVRGPVAEPFRCVARGMQYLLARLLADKLQRLLYGLLRELRGLHAEHVQVRR